MNYKTYWVKANYISSFSKGNKYMYEVVGNVIRSRMNPEADHLCVTLSGVKGLWFVSMKELKKLCSKKYIRSDCRSASIYRRVET